MKKLQDTTGVNTKSYSIYDRVHVLMITGVALLFPWFVFAQDADRGNCGPFTGTGASKDTIKGILDYPTCIINRYLIPIATFGALLLFMIGIIRYVVNADKDEERKKGSQFIMWGLIALFVMLAIWGLVAFIQNTLQIGTVR